MVTLNTTCILGGHDFQPDIGVWFIKPTQAQRTHPIINKCPPPDVWIEVSIKSLLRKM